MCVVFIYFLYFSFVRSFVYLLVFVGIFSIFVCLSQCDRIRCLVFAIIVALRCLLLLLSLLLIPHLSGDTFFYFSFAYFFSTLFAFFIEFFFQFSLFSTTAAIALDYYDLLLCYCSRRLYYTNTIIMCLFE